MNRRNFTASLALLAACSGAMCATIPTDCEDSFSMPDRLYSYFGGVSSFTAAAAPQWVYSGGSMGLTINFQPSVFGVAGVAIGTLGVSTPSLAVPPDADTFSITVRGPSSGTMKFYVLLREDDNSDFVIDLTLGDDEWQSPELTIPANVTTTFNIPLSSFTLTANSTGDGIQEFTTTDRLAMVVDIHSRTSYPGGIITSPRTIYLDHMGLFHGPQTPLPPCSNADFNNDRSVNTIDLGMLLSKFGDAAAPGTAQDMNGDGIVNSIDLGMFLSAFGQVCP